MSTRPMSSCLAVLVLAGSACAQWSTSAGTNLAVGDRINEQNQAKVRARADGGCWITWYDNAAGGYDVYIQRLDAGGNEMLPHNGVLVRDTGFSSTQDYDLRVDASGNAVLAFRDDVSVPGSVKVTLQKVAPDGTLVLGPTGLQVSTGTAANNPKCAVLSDGAIAVAWSANNTVLLQRVSVDNVVEWVAPVVISEASRALNISDVQASDNGSFIVLYVRCGGTNCITSNKHLYTQKFSGAGTPQWDGNLAGGGPNDPVIVFDGTSIQNGTFPFFKPDGQGGAIYGWYETGGSRRAYVQRITNTGFEFFGHNGVPVLTTAGLLQISAGFDVDPVAGDIYMLVKTTNTNQNQWGLRASRVDFAGNRQWGNDGIELLPMTGVQTNFERALARPSTVGGGMVGSEFYWFENASNPPGGRVFAAALTQSGAPGWTNFGGGNREACSAFSGKARLDVARGTLGNAMLVWGDSRSDVNDIYAQSMLNDGTPGAPDPACPPDFNGDGLLDPDDLADFVTCFFAMPICTGADYNGDMIVDPDDLSDYITAYFAGCV